MVHTSRYRRNSVQVIVAALCGLLLSVAAACGLVRAPALTEAAAPYRPAVIASGVASRPGALAWSPDGNRLAFLNGTVTIVDVAGEVPVPERIAVSEPRYLAWSDDGTLLVLSRERDQDALLLIDAARTGIIRKPLDRRADAVYPVDRRRSLLLSVDVARLKIGTEVRWTLSLLDVAAGPASTLHGDSRIVPAADADRDLLTAWALAGLNSLDGSFLVMELVKPPALAAYSRIQAFDPASGDLADLTLQDRRAVRASAAWSPDGRKIALTGPDGRLHVQDLQEGGFLDIPAPGLYPAWRPAGDLLAVGGSLVHVASGESAPLVRNGGRSFATWSPDGTRLALIAEGSLVLLRDFGAEAPPAAQLDRELRKKLAMLRELLGDGLITREEYRERRSRLLSDKKGRTK